MTEFLVHIATGLPSQISEICLPLLIGHYSSFNLNFKSSIFGNYSSFNLKFKSSIFGNYSSFNLKFKSSIFGNYSSFNLKFKSSISYATNTSFYNNHSGVHNSRFRAKSHFFYFYIVRIIGVTFSEVFFVPLIWFPCIILTKRVWEKHEEGKEVYIETNCVSFCLFNSSYNWTSSLPSCVKYTLHLQ